MEQRDPLLTREEVLEILRKEIKQYGSMVRFSAHHHFSAPLISVEFRKSKYGRRAKVISPCILAALELEAVIFYRPKQKDNNSVN